MRRTTRFRQLVEAPEILVMPGVHDALGAKIAEQAGFAAITSGGYSSTATLLGEPDTSQLSMMELADHYARLCDAVGVPVFGDGDTGFGNVTNVRRTVRAYERAGLAGMFIEDQTFPKRCGHMPGKGVIPAEEMLGKIKAALDARRSRETLVIARTDAIAVEGFERAIERAVLYRDAGADVLFVEAPKTRAELERIAPALSGVPLMANMVEGGKTPPLSASELEAMGFALVIFPGGVVRALARTASEYYASLAAHGTSAAFRSRMLDFTGINELVGTPEMLALGKRYESPVPPSSKKTGTQR